MVDVDAGGGWATGDDFGIAFPTHPRAFEQAGADWLTSAFRRFGALAADNAVSRIVSVESCPGGATGAKLIVTVEYARPNAGLKERLFVKFSRDFGDPRRDAQRFEMQSEARFAGLSRICEIPVRVPITYFADFESGSGSGLLITEAVPFGRDGIEPQRRKCLDHLTLDDPLVYYRTILTSVARLGGSHKAGLLPHEIEARFPYDPASATADPIRFDAAKLDDILRFNVEFSGKCPQRCRKRYARLTSLRACAGMPGEFSKTRIVSAPSCYPSPTWSP